MIFNLGSINIDYVYTLKRLPKPGETLSASRMSVFPGGKGLNMSVAIRRSGGDVCHVGAVGRGDGQVRAMLAELGIQDSHIIDVDVPTGHAIVYLDESSENQIVILGGANQAITEEHVRDSLQGAGPGDWLLLQNETNANRIGLRVAREKGMKVALVAAPFDAGTLPDLIREVDLVSMNRSETAEFERTTGQTVGHFEGPDFLITYGSDGASFVGSGLSESVAAHAVKPVDTTGAGDTFFGAFMALYSQGESIGAAMRYASAAAALQVQRPGAAVAIPTRAQVLEFLAAAPLS